MGFQADLRTQWTVLVKSGARRKCSHCQRCHQRQVAEEEICCLSLFLPFSFLSLLHISYNYLGAKAQGSLGNVGPHKQQAGRVKYAPESEQVSNWGNIQTQFVDPKIANHWKLTKHYFWIKVRNLQNRRGSFGWKQWLKQNTCIPIAKRWKQPKFPSPIKWTIFSMYMQWNIIQP